MRKLFALTGCALIVAATSDAISAENSLFSKVRTESVFVSPNNDSQAAPRPRLRQAPQAKVTGDQLVQRLGDAGFTAERGDSRTVSTVASAAGRFLPVQITISEDGSQLTIALLLSTIKSEESITPDKLLSILAVNRKYASASFVYNAELKRFEIDAVLKSEKVSADVLRSTIDRLAKITTETESLWRFEATSKTPPPATTAELGATTPSLAGKWSATRSKSEAFAIQLNADSTFLLVYVNNGQKSQSKGKFTVAGKRLTLEGEGNFRLAGTINSPNSNEFQFRSENSTSAALVFKRAK